MKKRQKGHNPFIFILAPDLHLIRSGCGNNKCILLEAR